MEPDKYREMVDSVFSGFTSKLKQDSDLYIDKADYVRQAYKVAVWVCLALRPCMWQ